jgi:hypothetical protein
MREEDKRSPSVTEEESINSVWALLLLVTIPVSFTLLLQSAVVEKYIMYYLFIYLVVHDLNLAILML